MIQRIQSIWLALAWLCLSTLFFVPNYFLTVTRNSPDKVETANFFANMAGPVMLALASVATFMSIFLFMVRPQQVKIARLALLNTFLFMVISGLLMFVELQKEATEKSYAFNWAIFLPITAMVLQILAIRAIKSDENLVQSAERLR